MTSTFRAVVWHGDEGRSTCANGVLRGSRESTGFPPETGEVREQFSVLHRSMMPDLGGEKGEWAPERSSDHSLWFRFRQILVLVGRGTQKTGKLTGKLNTHPKRRHPGENGESFDAGGWVVGNKRRERKDNQTLHLPVVWCYMCKVVGHAC